MKILNEYACYNINKFFKIPLTAYAVPSEEQYKGADRPISAFDGLVNYENKEVLDIGCGTGGVTVKISEQGVKRIIGIDHNEISLEQARQFAVTKNADSKVEFIKGDVSRLEFADNSFDVVFSCSGFEHFHDCVGALNEAYRVLRNNGLFLIDFATYPSFLGHHLFGTLNMPFAHLLFSEKTIINVAKRVKEERPDAPWCDWIITRKNGDEFLGGLNKITIDQFEMFIRQSQFEISYLNYVPLKKSLHPLSLISKIPYLKDLNIVYIHCVLKKI